MMREWQGTILALDIATTTGWAEGEPGGVPKFGTIRFAPPSSEQAAISAGAIKWIAERVSAFPPRCLVFEAPELFRLRSGKATRATIEVLFGLPFAISGTARLSGVSDIQEATSGDVRDWFLGKGGRRMKREIAKKAVVAECHRRGWEVRNDDEADACAIWAFMCAIKVPALQAESAASPLFNPETVFTKPAPPAKPARRLRYTGEEEIPL